MDGRIYVSSVGRRGPVQTGGCTRVLIGFQNVVLGSYGRNGAMELKRKLLVLDLQAGAGMHGSSVY